MAALRQSRPMESISVATEKLGATRSAAVPLAKVFVERGAMDGDVEARREVNVELLAPKRPGLMRAVSDALTVIETTVDELHPDCLEASMDGEIPFKAMMRLSVPEGIGSDDLQHALKALADELMIDLTQEHPASNGRDV